jgi:hypothetical protein
MGKRGPKPAELDNTQFNKLCAMQCTMSEIASWFDISVDTLERWAVRVHGVKLAELYNKKRESGYVSIRRAQFQAMEDGVPSILIWLGKQYLGQSDKQEIDLSKGEIKIVIDKEDSEL